MNTLSRGPMLAALASVACVLAVLVAGSDGVLDRHYTDHLRHMGEAVVWPAHGFDLYRINYEQVQPEVGLGPDHLNMWTDEPLVVPPLVVLLHAPAAMLEKNGTLSPSVAHSALGLMFALLGGLCLGALASVLFSPGQSALHTAFFWLTIAPLVIGSGVNGFPDVAFFLMSALALLAMQRQAWASAVICWALCGALHFRAGVFLPVAGFALVQLLRSTSFSAPRKALTVALALIILAPAGFAAFTVLGHTHFENVNPIGIRLKARFLVFSLLTLTTAGLSLFRGHRLVAASILASAFMASTDPHHAYWHAFVLLAPYLVAKALEVNRDSHVESSRLALVFGLMGTALAYVYRATPWWQWLVDRLLGH